MPNTSVPVTQDLQNFVAFAELHTASVGFVMSVRPSARPSVRLPACPSVRLPDRPSVRLPVRPSARPSVRLPVRPSVCPSVRPHRTTLRPLNTFTKFDI